MFKHRCVVYLNFTTRNFFDERPINKRIKQLARFWKTLYVIFIATINKVYDIISIIT